nr:MAG TPA: hypothetical protein [Caudoviricetes sp.]
MIILPKFHILPLYSKYNICVNILRYFRIF